MIKRITTILLFVMMLTLMGCNSGHSTTKKTPSKVNPTTSLVKSSKTTENKETSRKSSSDVKSSTTVKSSSTAKSSTTVKSSTTISQTTTIGRTPVDPVNDAGNYDAN